LRTQLTILKLGGSLVTNKDVPLSVKPHALMQIAKAISSAGLPTQRRKLVLVHGGGSFGHYYAKMYHLSREPHHIPPLGIARTAAAMLRLHSLVIESLLRAGIATETILPSELMAKDLSSLSKRGIKHIFDSFQNDLVPISFGHVGINGNKAFIISGDVICKAIAKSLQAREVIFAMDVDGIYPNSDLKGEIISRLSKTNSIETDARRYDVTGGLQSKLELGFELHGLGARVFYVNGTKPARLRNLLLGRVEKVATQIVS
jgi:isopentenyl phosphate kinase